MNPTTIEWLRNPDGSKGFSWNVISGCNGPDGKGPCFYCYGQRWADRFNHGDFSPTWHPERLDEPRHRKKATRIFAGSVTDFFGDWVSDDQLDDIFDVMTDCQQHTFYLLTKQAHNIMRRLYDGETATRFMHRRLMPDNVWVGVSVTCTADLARIGSLRDAWPGHKFVSIEPMLTAIDPQRLGGMEWIIIGRMTGPHANEHRPRSEWVWHIADAVRGKVPLFIKDNLATALHCQNWPT